MGCCMRKPKKEAHSFRHRQSSRRVDMDNMRSLFRQFDTNGDGFIQKSELKDAMNKMGQSMTDEEVDRMFNTADTNKDGNIDFNEFLTIARSNPHAQEVNLKDMFFELDVNMDGFITRDEVQQVFQRLGQVLSEEDVQLIFDQMDANKDGRIDFEEFRRIMTSK